MKRWTLALGLIGLALLCMAASCETSNLPPGIPCFPGGAVCDCYVRQDGGWFLRVCPSTPPSAPPSAPPVTQPSAPPSPCASCPPPPSPCPDCPSPKPSEKPSPPPTCDPQPPCPCGFTGATEVDACGLIHPVCAECPPPAPQEPDCKVEFTPHRTTWGFLGCTPASEGCDGNGCTFTVPPGTKCSTDSTPTYLGQRPNWKTCECAGDERPCPDWPGCMNGHVGRSEYPPGPRPPNPRKGDPGHPGFYGHQCSVTTVWTVPAGVEHNEHDGFGGEMKFKTRGRFQICAAPKGRPSPELRTCKTAVVQ